MQSSKKREFLETILIPNVRYIMKKDIPSDRWNIENVD